MPRGVKRLARVPDAVVRMSYRVSKNRLLEALYDASGLLSGYCDSEEESIKKMKELLERLK